jgi:hypothetical protein
MMLPFELFITRLPVLRSEMVDASREYVEVDHTMDPFTSLKTKLPSRRNDISDLWPLTGESRFAVHTTVLLLIELVNQMEKVKAFLPNTGWNPQEKVLSSEVRKG